MNIKVSKLPTLYYCCEVRYFNTFAKVQVDKNVKSFADWWFWIRFILAEVSTVVIKTITIFANKIKCKTAFSQKVGNYKKATTQSNVYTIQVHAYHHLIIYSKTQSSLILQASFHSNKIVIEKLWRQNNPKENEAIWTHRKARIEQLNLTNQGIKIYIMQHCVVFYQIWT